MPDEPRNHVNYAGVAVPQDLLDVGEGLGQDVSAPELGRGPDPDRPGVHVLSRHSTAVECSRHQPDTESLPKADEVVKGAGGQLAQEGHPVQQVVQLPQQTLNLYNGGVAGSDFLGCQHVQRAQSVNVNLSVQSKICCAQEVVCGLAHRRANHDRPIPLVSQALDQLRHVPQAVAGGEAGPPKLDHRAPLLQPRAAHAVERGLHPEIVHQFLGFPAVSPCCSRRIPESRRPEGPRTPAC
mmetsp:Transcript_13868/g.20449  ORF Transcript_13868/g.20449 Transcript_13868/m.20449 type:complete len:239 (+) Transcript_13868:1066-1782(+)